MHLHRVPIAPHPGSRDPRRSGVSVAARVKMTLFGNPRLNREGVGKNGMALSSIRDSRNSDLLNRGGIEGSVFRD